MATAERLPSLRGVTLACFAEGTVPLNLAASTPFADGRFPTPSGKVELFSQTLADRGIDPLPGRFLAADDDGGVTERRPRLSDGRGGSNY